VKHDFNENHIAETLDPLDAQEHEFDWEALYARLDVDARNGGNDPDLSGIVTRLLQMLLPAPGQKLRPSRVGMRVIALAWVLSPAYFDRNPSLNQLARRCRVSATTLGELTGEFSRQIGWRNRAQQRGWNWQRSERPPLSEGDRSPASGGESASGQQPKVVAPSPN
jgi:hypothetical protein